MFLEEAVFENEQLDRAMAAMGIAQNLKKEEDVIVARGVGATSVLAGLGQARSQGIFAGGSTSTVRYFFLPQVVLEHVTRQRKRKHEFIAAWKAWRRQFQIQVQCLQSDCTWCALLGPVRFCRSGWNFYRERSSSLGSVSAQISAPSPCFLTRRNLDSVPTRRHISNKEVHGKLGLVLIAMELRIRRVGWARRMAEQIQK